MFSVFALYHIFLFIGKVYVAKRLSRADDELTPGRHGTSMC